MQQCAWTRSRTGGPGGQHRNKVQTAVELIHTPTGVRAKAGERRSVRDNVRAAIGRLRLALAVEHRVGRESASRIAGCVVDLGRDVCI